MKESSILDLEKTALRSPALSKINHVEHFFLTAQQRPPHLACQLRQTHSSTIHWLGNEQGHSAHETTLGAGSLTGDGILSSTQGAWIGVQTADCVPVLMASKIAPVVAAIHAGWRGTLNGIVLETIEALQRRGHRPHDFQIALGPSLGPCCFEAGHDVLSAFEEKWGWMWVSTGRPYSSTRRTDPFESNGHGIPSIRAPQHPQSHWLDLKAILELQFVNAGVPHPQIDTLELCTYCGVFSVQGQHMRAETNDFASHRRCTHQGLQAGRQWSVIRLSPAS